MSRLPEIVTHTFHPDRGPFRNLCALPDVQAERVLGEMRAVGRCLHPNYLTRRRATESWLRDVRAMKLGKTPLELPIYFFVGDFADGRDPARPRSVQLPLAELPPHAITFSYGDSMSSGEAFTLAEVAALVAERGLPQRESDFIELQLWDSSPLLKYIARLSLRF